MPGQDSGAGAIYPAVAPSEARSDSKSRNSPHLPASLSRERARNARVRVIQANFDLILAIKVNFDRGRQAVMNSKTPDQTALGGRISAAIEKCPLNQKQIAGRLDVSENTISNWKRGSQPKARNLLALAEVIGIGPAELGGSAFLEKRAVRAGEMDASDDRSPREEEFLEALAALRRAAPELRSLVSSLPTLLDALGEAEAEARRQSD